ncbi:hypothetical protein LCGC14_0070330 [marine sediment metagenome]|uniref:Lipoyl-binding domain-containing protein n=2 Tax=root TaxID=1 RepID=A0A0F9VLL8_9ZZZZ
MEDLKANPHFRSTKEMERDDKRSNEMLTFELKTGEIQTIVSPDLGNQKDLVLNKWKVKIGDRVKSGNVLCEISNKAITMEYESFYNGKIIWICEHKKDLVPGDTLCKIEGI